MSDISKDLIAASSKPLVLSILAEGESYGYAIIREVRKRSGGELAWTDGMLYPVLHRLQRDGLLTSKWKTSDTGRKRKYYRLNARGKKALAAERQQWYAVHQTLAQFWGPDPCLT